MSDLDNQIENLLCNIREDKQRVKELQHQKKVNDQSFDSVIVEKLVEQYNQISKLHRFKCGSQLVRFCKLSFRHTFPYKYFEVSYINIFENGEMNLKRTSFNIEYVNEHQFLGEGKQRLRHYFYGNLRSISHKDFNRQTYNRIQIRLNDICGEQDGI